MIKIGIVCDNNWDNFILINNKLKKINPDLYTINALYCKTLEIINNCCIKNELTLIRNYSESLSKTIYNMLKTCNIWLIFTNNVEYNTPPQLVIDKCNEFNIKYIIVSEHNRNNDYYSYETNKDTFKKNLANISKHYNDHITSFTEEIYDDIFNKKSQISLTVRCSIKDKLKKMYNNIEQTKKEHYIKLLYDKDEIKKDKQIKKTIKTINQITFSSNRLNYYKNKSHI